MKAKQKTPTSIDAYIATFPTDVQVVLEGIRETIREGAPLAIEKISYQIPTFFQQGNLVHFAAWKSHIGFYPTSTGVAKFQKELAKYSCSKGAVQFPLDKPMPLALIRKIVQFRVRENLAKVAGKKAKTKKAKTK